ncbi:MAG: DUF4013 domain-containing protein [Methanobacteriaceae archaeon]|nr:DUF4013 domain-containing protein [Candidatus Methanorudis spinitermitis]
MEITKLFEDALKYPTKDWNKLLTLGGLTLIPMIVLSLLIVPIALNGSSLNYNYLASLSVTMLLILAVAAILAIILGIIYWGYELSIIRNTIALKEELPEFEWGNLIVDGLKVLVLSIVYSIIPGIVSFIMMLSVGFLSATASNTSSIVFANLFLFLIVFIISIIFQLLLYIAMGKLAETDSLSDAINFIDVFNKIGEIGWANYIIWIIINCIILAIIGFIMGIISIIPIIGALIAFVLFIPYIVIYHSRALGLLYNESKN